VERARRIMDALGETVTARVEESASWSREEEWTGADCFT
jgi:hypothetical protein